MSIDNTVIEHKCLIKKIDNKKTTTNNLEKKSIKEELKNQDIVFESPIKNEENSMNNIFESKAVEAEAVEANTVEAIEAEEVDVNAVEEQAVESEAVESEAVESEAVESEAVESEAVESEAVEVDAVEVDAVEAEAKKYDINNDDLRENEIEEITLDVADENLDKIQIREPSEIYYEIYQTAKHKAKELKTKALKAHLEAKQIKVKYMLEDSDDSDNDDIQNYLE